MAVLVVLLANLVATGAASALVVRGPHGHAYGILPRPGSAASRRAGAAVNDPVRYRGGPVMLSSRLHLIFWGPAGSFPAHYENPIIQWAKGLGADTGKTTNEFSVGSLFYMTVPHPQRHRLHVSTTVTFGGAVNDTRPFPANGCMNPDTPHRVCLSGSQLETEVARAIRVEHWPTDRPMRPRDQYLLFTPEGVDSCADPTETECTFFSKIQFCAYHSAFAIGSRAVVWSNMPNIPDCLTGQAPAGVLGDYDTDGTLNSAIHEVVESVTDPDSTLPRSYSPAWIDNQGSEVGDRCHYPLPESAVFGQPLGGDLALGTAFNQVIGGQTYYTQQMWALATPRRPVQGCAARVGPSPVFSLPSSQVAAGQPVSFNGSRSYDLEAKITQYAWNYGDGSPVDTAHGAHGVHTYTQPGQYQVSLTVSDATGPGNASTEVQTVEVH
ncbi:MAG: PKD domain-containing protein [Solirubrobacteraceae bacterium]